MTTLQKQVSIRVIIILFLLALSYVTLIISNGHGMGLSSKSSASAEVYLIIGPRNKIMEQLEIMKKTDAADDLDFSNTKQLLDENDMQKEAHIIPPKEEKILQKLDQHH